MITEDELRAVVAPFSVYSVHNGRKATITGFSKNDPLGVGGAMGIIPNLATAYFEGGGWSLVSDLCRHWSLSPQCHKVRGKPGRRAKSGKVG